MKIKYQIADIETGKVLLKRHTILMAVDVVSGKMSYASPEVFLKRLESHIVD
jgi:acyl-CoA thioester hydrolase